MPELVEDLNETITPRRNQKRTFTKSTPRPGSNAKRLHCKKTTQPKKLRKLFDTSFDSSSSDSCE